MCDPGRPRLLGRPWYPTSPPLAAAAACRRSPLLTSTPYPPPPQGTVKQKLAGTLRLDDGTGAVDCLCGVKDQPGLEIDRCTPGAYVLVQGKVLAKQGAGDRQQLLIKAQKVGALKLCMVNARGSIAMHFSQSMPKLWVLDANRAPAAASPQVG